MAGETLIWHPEQPSNEAIADHFGIPEVAIIELRNAMQPFADEYRRPFDVFRFFKDRQEVVFHEREYRWKINGIGFNASDVGGSCGKISISFGRSLLASKETLLGPFYSNDFVLGFVPKARAPYFFPDNHIVLALFRQNNNEAIVLDPSLGLIDIGATYPGMPYTILSAPTPNYSMSIASLKRLWNYGILSKTEVV